MNTKLHAILSVGLILSSATAFAANDLLPALAPEVSVLEQNKLAQDPTTGVIQLQFSNAIANSGAGVLHVVAYRNPVVGTSIDLNNDTIPAYQRILRDDGSTYDVSVGEVVYHPEHHHFHFMGAAKYELLDSSGNVIRESPKVSFCLADVTKISPLVPNTPNAPVYNSCAHDPYASFLEMGISVGWMDIYGEDLIGQAFDVSDLMQLPLQNYTLRTTTNPLGLLYETNPHPVSVEITVQIGAGAKVVMGKSRPGV